MNPAQTDQDDALLDTLLRDSAPDPVPDAGFVDALMMRLPPPRTRSPRAVWLGLVAGTGLAAWQLQDNPVLDQIVRDWSSGHFSLMSAAVLVAALITALCASAAVLTE